MRDVTWRALTLVVVMAWVLPGCDLDPLGDLSLDLNPTVEATPANCAKAPADGWWLALQGRPPIEVGDAVPILLMEPLFYSGCTRFLTSLEWKTSVPEVLAIGPGDRVGQAILTGMAPGETHVVAELTLVGGYARTATLLHDEAVAVVPAQ
jgi:hypothetical protein